MDRFAARCLQFVSCELVHGETIHVADLSMSNVEVPRDDCDRPFVTWLVYCQTFGIVGSTWLYIPWGPWFHVMQQYEDSW